MRILIISNLYPPYYVGGYELGCRDVVERLKSRGHEIRILTSNYGLERPRVDGEVHRWLMFDLRRQLQYRGKQPLKKEIVNQRAFSRIFRAFRPEIIYIWNLTGVSTSLALAAEHSGIPVFYFVSDKHWSQLGSNEADPWYRILSRSFPNPKPVIRIGVNILDFTLKRLGFVFSGTLTFPRVHFVSDFLKQDALRAGKPVAHGEVIHWGVDIERFSHQPRTHKPKRLLFVGQITSNKGVVTAIEVMRLIVGEYGRRAVTLTFVGGSVIPNYLDEMQELVRSYGLEDNVRFVGSISREHLPDIYRGHDILIFPSLLDEALTITTLEAMACGLAVVTTANGGNLEVFHHEVNALVFPKEDAEAAARWVLKLLDDEELFHQLSRNGRRTVHEKFNLQEMVNAIERSLQPTIDKSDR